MSTSINNPLTRVVFVQIVLKFAPANSARLAELATTTSVFLDTVSNYGRAILHSWAKNARIFDVQFRRACVFDIGSVLGLNLVKQFIAEGASPSDTLLAEVAGAGHAETLKLLLTASPPPNVDAVVGSNWSGATPLIVAAEQGHAAVVRVLLNANARIEATNNFGITALLTAAASDHLEVVRALLTANPAPNVNAASIRGTTSLQLASEGGHVEIVRLLLSSKRCHVDAVDELGRTALHLCARNGHADVVRELVEVGGADPALRDRARKTPGDYARDKFHTNVLAVLP